VLFDFFHAFTCGVVGAKQMGERQSLPGGVAQFAHMLTGKIGHVHFSDCSPTVDSDNTPGGTRTPFGKGALDFDAVVPAVLQAGYTGTWWSIDLGSVSFNALVEAAPAKSFMDDLARRYS